MFFPEQGDFDHNFAYFSVHSMSKGFMKNHIKICDFKEFWFDGRERGKFNYVKGVKNIVDELLSKLQIFGEFLSGETLIFFVIHSGKRSLIKMFQCFAVFYIFACIARFMVGRLENVFDIVSGQYTATIVADILLPGTP